MSDTHYLKRRFPLFLTKMMGGDYQLLLRSGNVVARKYFQASAILLMDLLITIFSVFYGTDLLFHSWQLELFLALFISALFGCIYLFLISTFSKQTLIGKFFRLSNLVRIGFTVFIAFIISKPIEIFIFSERLEGEVSSHKEKLLKQYVQRIDQLHSVEYAATNTAMKKLKQQIALYPSVSAIQELEDLKFFLSESEITQSKNIETATKQITRSDFLLYRIQLVSHHIGSWLVCFAIIILFLLPGYLIFSIPSDETYYLLKETTEKTLINDEYLVFKERFTSLFRQNWGLILEPYSCFEDPPFNTKRIQTSEALSNEEFIARYL